MRRVLFVLGLIGIFVLIYLVVIFSNQAKLEGKVTDALTKKPLANASIKIEKTSTNSDASGRYQLFVKQNKTYSISVSARGYEGQVKKVKISKKKTSLNFALRNGTLEGDMRTNNNQAPVRGATVKIEDKKATSDKYGRFKLSSISVGKTRIRVFLREYKLLEQEVNIVGGPNKLSLVVNSTYPDPSLNKLMAEATTFQCSFKPIPPVVIRRGNPNQKKVALTIDDGWNNDDRILDLLESHHIKVTVFVIGGRGIAEKHPDWIARMDRDGFEVCTHTYSHFIITGLSDQQLTEELRKGQQVLSNVTHKQYPYMRPCGGGYDQRTLNVVAKNGYKMILWDNTLADTVKQRTTEQRIQYVLSNLRNGSIILCHFGGYNTYDALKVIVPEILKRGYKITTVSEVLEGM